MQSATLSRNYLQTTESVVRAGRRLQKYLESDKAKVGFAVSQLESAANEHGNKSASYQAFLFNSLETAPTIVKPQATGDLLASVLADFQTANVLIAAGQVMGETGQKGDPRGLEQALQHLESTQHSIERAQKAGAVPGRFGFAETASAEKPRTVVTTQGLAELAEGTLQVLTLEAQNVVMAVVEALDKIGVKQIGSALLDLGKQASALVGIGRLFSQGVRKLRAAIDSLIRLFGSKTLEVIQERIDKLWQDLKEGKLVPALLEQAFAIESTHQIVKTKLVGELDAQHLSHAADELSQLKIRFQDDMALARRLCAAIGIAVGVLAATPIAGHSIAVAAGAYGVILAGVVLTGQDYADSGHVLNRVRGVGQIIMDAAVPLSVAGTGTAA